MNQDPTMQGGNTPDQGNNNPNDTMNPAAVAGAGPDPSSNQNPNPNPDLNPTPVAEPLVNQSTQPVPSTTESTPSYTNPSATPDWMKPSGSDGMPVGSVVEPAVKPKKSNSLKIALIILLIVILGLGGLAIWYFAFYSNPEKVAYDAVANFIQAKNITLKGTTFKVADIESGHQLNISLSPIEASSNGQAGSVNSKLIIKSTEKDVDTELEIELGATVVDDGTIYLRVGKIMEAIEKIESAAEALDASTAMFLSIIKDFLAELDNEWWQISIPDIIDEITTGDSDADDYKKFYSCTIEALKTGRSSELTKLYSDNRFIDVEKIGPEVKRDDEIIAPRSSGENYNYYQATINYDTLASFINAMPDTEMAKSITACATEFNNSVGEEVVSIDEFEDITTDDLKNLSNNNFEIYLAIEDVSHQLRGVVFNEFNLSASLVGGGSVWFSYDPVSISAPTNYRPFTELVDSALEMIGTILLGTGGSSWDYDADLDDWYMTDEDLWGDDEFWNDDDFWSDEDLNQTPNGAEV